MAKSVTDKVGFIQFTIPPGAYENESLKGEIKRITIDEEQFTEAKYHFTIKPKFSILDSILEFLKQIPIISFLPNDLYKRFYRD